MARRTSAVSVSGGGFRFCSPKAGDRGRITQLECRLHVGSKPKKFPVKDRKVPRLRLKANIVVVPRQVPMQGVWKAVPDPVNGSVIETGGDMPVRPPGDTQVYRQK